MNDIKDIIAKKAEEYVKKDCCFLYAEMNETGNGTVTVAGDPVAALFGVCSIIQNISENTSTPSSLLLDDIKRIMCDNKNLENKNTEEKA